MLYHCLSFDRCLRLRLKLIFFCLCHSMRSHGDSKRNEIFFDDITLCNYPLWAQLKLQTCSRQCFCLLVLSARGYLCMCALFYEVLNFSMKEKKNRLLRLFFLPVVERIFKTRLRYKFFSGKAETRWREKKRKQKIHRASFETLSSDFSIERNAKKKKVLIERHSFWLL